MSNPFSNWTKEQVEAHNARVSGKKVSALNPLNSGTRIRQSPKPLLNKLETSFSNEYLRFNHPKARAQAIKFALGNGIAYKPDFVDLTAQPVTAFEIKGPHAFRGGFENLKVAAGLYPEIRWILVWKENGQWQQQEVLP